MQSASRVHSIDYLRGLMASGIMLYHFFYETFGIYSADTFLGRVGIYGVSVFYIISGISMSLAYSNMRLDLRSISNYWIRRIFRIAPLFWLSSLVTLFLWFYVNPSIKNDWLRYIANFSLFFGFYDLRAYIPMGGWSIGNEMFFYAFFPFIVLSLRKKYFSALFPAVFFLAYAYFAFYVISPDSDMATEWAYYINPLNQMFLFVLGVVAGNAYARGFRIGSKLAVYLLIFSSALFVFYPVSGGQINIVIGWNRLLFTFFIFLMCFSLIYIRFPVGGFIENAFRLMGEWSYSIYLLHGAVMFYLLKIFSPMMGVVEKFDKFMVLVFIGLPATAFLSYVVYEFMEKPMISVGRNITVRRTSHMCLRKPSVK